MGDVASPPSFDVTTTLRDLVLPQITSCYLDAVAASPGLHGKMLVSFDVNNQGTVTSAMETKSTVNSPTLSACIKSALLATVFPKPGGTATVNVPLVFRP
jgi:TonB family protein